MRNTSSLILSWEFRHFDVKSSIDSLHEWWKVEGIQTGKLKLGSKIMDTNGQIFFVLNFMLSNARKSNSFYLFRIIFLFLWCRSIYIFQKEYTMQASKNLYACVTMTFFWRVSFTIHCCLSAPLTLECQKKFQVYHVYVLILISILIQ